MKKNKWIISRHTRDIDLLVLVLKQVSGICLDKENEEVVLKKMGNFYNPRFGSLKISTLKSKVSQLSYYLFGYSNNRKFLISPLGYLYIKNINDLEKKKFVFLAMLWGIQYPNLTNKTSKEFEIFPFRLIIKLLTEERLSQKLYVSEISAIVMFQKKITKETYELLVNQIITFRNLSSQEVKEYFLNDKSSNLVNAVYEWDYYTKFILATNRIIHTNEGEVICTLSHGKNSSRKLKNTYIEINKDLLSFIKELEEEHPFTEEPQKPSSILTFDLYKKVYNFYPQVLNKYIEADENEYELSKILELPKLIKEYALNSKDENDAPMLFEKYLEQGFNLFSNIQAKRIGGAGNADVECIYLPIKEKFLVEAKSTANKLLLINSSRLETHQKKHLASYTIVITPMYSPAALTDIENRNIVILESNIFAEYLYNNLRFNRDNINYSEIYNIVIKNMGSDISEEVSMLTLDRFSLE